ncbi:MAG: Bug family tripartite tricarboxylate transporter substrate binding protein [Tepidimonas sp.]|uniref:Bug family tripartite tricarboxylate transporter substrate binding protein n=1 Tax=Tepidimonas sp. TaxID=2002775 RepID=UPI00298F2446|nr:Bug family tripartite tricarboxylate transporter substrate binding protein [Tepidimonas sp.]MCS6810314.1 Bug family tripartite tricarboxylate transporter substrate binding protein [Tepidimonas sp.]MDW8336545.1 Bug family tripartite tricarboxylate transporter substrate binding protein [Tepidimonas sp.]
MHRCSHPNRRHFVIRTAAAAAAVASPWFAHAEARAIRILVGFPPGGGTDAIARLLAEPLRETLGVPVVVDNRAGAGGQLAAQALKAAVPDGTTLLLTHDHTVSILPLVLRHPGFDPARDFVAVGGFATFVNALAVSGGTPARSLREFTQWVRSQGGKAAVGIPAPASVPQFLVQVLARQQQLDLVAVPYRGSGPMMADMLGNQIPAGVGSIPDFIEHHRAGKLHVVAVMGRQRQPALPEVPTFAELGISGFEEVPFYGLFAPAGTPAAVLAQLDAALARVVMQPAVRERLTAMGLNVGHMSGEQLAVRERAYREVWARIIRDSGFQPQ